ncbi:ribonuclease P protein subunit p25-like protein [Hibiscus syriacus]|uniref:ribonuclease P protein subunit p25-like protein n=1 Tax=Hibiscus syriacus TaxID=106335 RepID=UPI001923F75C|nr:ribonuclease P protein subunit p25-like protein [Hibiscus syriacus]
MDRYQKVEKPKPESPINENEIRITSQGAIRNYINYAIALLQDKHVKEIVLKAMGQAISKTVAIAEILKKRVPRLHQDTAINSVSITDIWEPIEEGLVPVEMTRQVSMISITLSTKELNKNSVGYQAPHYAEQPKPQYHYQQQQPPKQARVPYNAVNEDSYGQGRGRGRGRGRGQSWGRGGYSNYGNYQDNGGYSNWGRGGGRERGWGYRGAGYERGRGGGGRGYSRGRGRMGGGRSRGGDY